MKKLSGTLKLDLAQYRELEAFAKFGSDLDPTTQRQLNRGARSVELLKQGLNKPLPVSHQVVLLSVNNEGLMDSLKIEQIAVFEKEFTESVTVKHQDEMAVLEKTGVLAPDFMQKILAEAKVLINQLSA